jgi:hypothetical protein
LSDVGLTCDGVFHERLPSEGIDTMIERVALALGDGGTTFTLQYNPALRFR